MDDFVLLDLFRALDLFGIERMPDSSFSAITLPPAWLTPISGFMTVGAPITLAEAFPFLDSFLRDAEAFWYKGTARVLRSGAFVVDGTSEELLLRASAFNLGPCCLLVLERLAGEADTRPLLQKARESNLQRERLARQIEAVQASATEIARLAKELLETDLTTAQRQLAEGISRSTARMNSVTTTPD